MTQEASENLGLNQDSDLAADIDNNKDNDSDGFRGNKREIVGPPTKVVIRRLPSTMTFESFMEQISPVPDNDYLYFVRADMSLGQHAFSRAYINFLNEEDVFIFKDKFDGYVFVDQKGNEYSAVVEFSPFQKIPKKKSKKKDTKCGTIEQDADYIKFVDSLQNPKEVHLPTAENYLEEIESRQRELKANNGVLRVTTPLIEHIKQKKAEKLRMREEKREERKRREIEKKRVREEERKRRKAEKDKYCKDGDRSDDKTRVEPTVKLLKNPEREKEKRDVENERPDVTRLNRYQDTARLEKSKMQSKDKEWDRDRYKRHEEEDRQRQKDRQRRFRDRVKRDKDEHGFQTRVLGRDDCKAASSNNVAETEVDKAAARSGKDGFGGVKHDGKGRPDWHRSDYKSRRDEKLPRDGWSQRERPQVSTKDRDERRGKSYEKSREVAAKKEDGVSRMVDAKKTKYTSSEVEPATVSSSAAKPTDEHKENVESLDGKVEDVQKQQFNQETVPSDICGAKDDGAANEENYAMEDGKSVDKESPQSQRLDRRIRNKDRPSIALYRPGMRRLCTQKDSSQKDGGPGSPTSSSSPSPVPQVGSLKTTEGTSFDETETVNSGKSSESGNSVTEDK